jgi:hypothetical protein
MFSYAWNLRARVINSTGQIEGGRQGNTNITLGGQFIYVSPNTYNSSSSPLRLEQLWINDTTNGWGCIQHVNNSRHYFFGNCSLYIDTGNYFYMTEEVLEFGESWDMWMYGTAKYGQVYSGDKVYFGNTLIFNSCNNDYGGNFMYTNGEMYNTQVRHHRQVTSYTSNRTCYDQTGHWGAVIGSTTNQKIGDSYLEQFRHADFRGVDNSINNIKIYGSQIESIGAILSDITVFGAQLYAIRPISEKNASYLHKSDIGKVTSSPINPYIYNADNLVWYFVDCKYGTFSDTKKVYWTQPGTNDKVYEMYSMLIKVLYRNGTAVNNANATLKNKDGEVIFSVLTNTDGYIGVESGNVTSANASRITDSSKNWTNNRFWYQEFYITSGNAEGQRRIIKMNNTNNTLHGHVDFETTPANGSKFIIIPYVKAKMFEPITPESAGYVWSNTTTYNPFTLTIEMNGHPMYNSTFNFTRGLDEVITLDNYPFIVEGGLVFDPFTYDVILTGC